MNTYAKSNSLTQEIVRRKLAIQAVVRSYKLGKLHDYYNQICANPIVFFCDKAATDGQHIFLPAELIAAEEWDRSLTLGLMIHELGHCLFSDMSNIKKKLEKAAQDVRCQLLLTHQIQLSSDIDEAEAAALKRNLAFLANCWEDVRIDWLSRLSFSSGLMLVRYSNEAIIKAKISKMNDDDNAIVQYFSDEPLLRNIGMWELLKTYIKLFDDGKQHMLAQKRYLNLLDKHLSGILPPEAMQQLTALSDSMAASCSEDNIFEVTMDSTLAYKLAAKTWLIYSQYDPNPLSDNLSEKEQAEDCQDSGQTAAQTLLSDRDEFLSDSAKHSAMAGYATETLTLSESYKVDSSKADGITVMQRNQIEKSNKFCLSKMERASLKIYRSLRHCQDSCFNLLLTAKEWAEFIHKEHAGSLSRQLSKALRTQSLKHYNCRSRFGFKLASSAAAKLDQGVFVRRPFVKKGLCQSLKTHVVLLIDSSSSMNDDVSTAGVIRTMCTLYDGFSRIPSDLLKVSVYTFATVVKCIKEANEPFDRSVLCRIPKMDGCTDGWSALKIAVDELLASKCDRNIIICLTDGFFSDPQTSFDINCLSGMGIETYGIGYGFTASNIESLVASNSGPAFDTWFAVPNLMQLPEMVSRLFRELIVQSTK